MAGARRLGLPRARWPEARACGRGREQPRVEAELGVHRALQHRERRVLRHVRTLVAEEVLELAPAGRREPPRVPGEVAQASPRGLPETDEEDPGGGEDETDADE